MDFHSDHSHPLASPMKAHLYRCHRNISASASLQIEMAYDVGIPPKASHALLAKQVGGRDNLGFIPEDYKNYLRSKRTRDSMIGDTGGVLEYLQIMKSDDPGFFSAIQLDADDLITNIFWANSNMRSDYEYFGDVVCFDTTYRKNNEGRPIALFVGVNHHKQTIIFGAALLYDETALTFEWLFETFTTAMSHKKPTTILTDQDAAMAKALASKWPQTNHRLCIWHIYQNAAIHLSGVFQEFREFAKDFASCIYDYEEEEEFLEGWKLMLTKYGLEDNDWLKRMFRVKEKWALAYGRHMFCADMTTTQRSESMNGVLKRYVSYQHKFLEFFKHFQRLLEDRRYEELKADFKSTTSVPSLSYPIEILKDASKIYTPEAFKCFEQQWFMSHDCALEIVEDVDTHTRYKITPHLKRYFHTVTAHKSNNQIECSCRKFEFGGILCSHIIKVFTLRNIWKIPTELIRIRWTRTAKNGNFGHNDSVVKNNSSDPKLLQNMRFREMSALFMHMITRAAEREDTYMETKELLLIGCKNVDDKLQQPINIQTHVRIDSNVATSQSVKGIKAKKKPDSGKRLRGGLEKNTRKRKATTKTTQAANAATESTPPQNWNPTLTMNSNTPFTVLLSSPFSHIGSNSCELTSLNRESLE